MAWCLFSGLWPASSACCNKPFLYTTTGFFYAECGRTK